MKPAKVKTCLPWLHSYGRAHGWGSRMFVTCSICGKTKRA